MWPGARWYFSFMVVAGLAEVEQVLCHFRCCSWEGSVTGHTSCSALAETQWYGKHLPLKCESLAWVSGRERDIPQM